MCVCVCHGRRLEGAYTALLPSNSRSTPFFGSSSLRNGLPSGETGFSGHADGVDGSLHKSERLAA